MSGFFLDLTLAVEPRQVNLDSGSFADLAVDLYVAARLLDEAIDLAEAEARTFAYVLGGEKRVKSPRLHLGRHSDAVIGHGELNVLARHHFRLAGRIGVIE